MDVPLPWERLLWSSRSPVAPTRRYTLTDFRLVRVDRRAAVEVPLCDIVEVVHTRAALDRLLRTSTLLVYTRRHPHGNARHAALVLAHVRHGAQLAALIEWLAGDPRAHARKRPLDPAQVRAALSWTPRLQPAQVRGGVIAAACVVIALAWAIVGSRSTQATVPYAPDDAIYPGGVKRDRAAIAWFMEAEVMPWARAALGPIVGGPDQVTCHTCHGADAEARGWRMPAVAALPEPHVKERGWETYSSRMDAQMRNAIYGYAAESDNQARAGHMREVVLPGMANLLHRPAYDFTKSYSENRTKGAFGCYHCHQVQ